MSAAFVSKSFYDSMCQRMKTGFFAGWLIISEPLSLPPLSAPDLVDGFVVIGNNVELVVYDICTGKMLLYSSLGLKCQARNGGCCFDHPAIRTMITGGKRSFQSGVNTSSCFLPNPNYPDPDGSCLHYLHQVSSQAL